MKRFLEPLLILLLAVGCSQSKPEVAKPRSGFGNGGAGSGFPLAADVSAGGHAITNASTLEATAGVITDYATTITNSTTPPITLTVGKINPVDTSGGVVPSSSTLSYPNPATWSGRSIIIQDVGASFDKNNLTISQFGSEKINGTAASYVCNLRGAVLQLVSDGTNVWVYGTGQAAHSITVLADANYTLQASDAGHVLFCPFTADRTIFVPTNATAAIPLTSDSITIVNDSSHVVTIVATTPATTTLNSNVAGTFGVQTSRIGSSSNSSNRGVAVSLKKTAIDTWYMFGPTY